jgi:hypothetical protein
MTDEEVRDESGALIGHVVPHPRMLGYWLAMWKPRTPRDCGMKRYRTRRGAENRVHREWLSAPTASD